jgi:hypothetical protein
MTQAKSPTMAAAITPALRARPDYRGKELDDLLLVYRYFKEARNSLVHGGGVAM